MDTDDSLVRDKPRSTILDDIKAAARGTATDMRQEEPAEGEPVIALPQPGDPYEAAWSRQANKPVPTLYFIMGDTVRGLPYANMDSVDWLAPDKPGLAPSLVIRFTGLVPREAILEGRRLARLYELVGGHRITWVRLLPKGRDFKDDASPAITGITYRAITEMPV